jgi:hypothetical protein
MRVRVKEGEDVERGPVDAAGTRVCQLLVVSLQRFDGR